MKQWTDSKVGKEYNKATYCYPAYLNYMQSTSCKMSDWMKHKLKSRLLWEISITSDMEIWHHPYGRKWKGTRASWWKWKRREKKNWLKTQHLKMKIMAFSPITSWQTNGETMETVTDFIFLGSKITADGDCSREIKNSCSLEEKLR